jgi:hypothetical protein
MDPKLSEALRQSQILAASWYPISWYRELYRAIRAASGEGVELARKLGYIATKKDMATIHNRLISAFVSPQLLFKFATGLFNSYFDTGKFSVLESGRGHVKARLEGCFGFDAAMYSDCVGGSTALLEGAGAKEVPLHVLRGGCDGDEYMLMEAFWI